MDKTITEFRDQHALLLTEIKRLTAEQVDDTVVARNRELRSILRVVARDYLRGRVTSDLTEDELGVWLARLEAA